MKKFYKCDTKYNNYYTIIDDVSNLPYDQKIDQDNIKFYIECYKDALKIECTEDNKFEIITIYDISQGKKYNKSGSKESIITAPCTNCKEGLIRFFLIDAEEKDGKNYNVNCKINKIECNFKHKDDCRFNSTESSKQLILERINKYIDLDNQENNLLFYEKKKRKTFDWWLFEGIDILNIKSSEDLLRKVKLKWGADVVNKSRYPNNDAIIDRRKRLKAKENEERGITHATVENTELKIKSLFGSLDKMLSGTEFKTPICLDYNLISHNDFFIQLTSKAHIHLYYMNRKRSARSDYPRPAVIAIDGTFNILKTKNQVQINISAMDVDHKYYPISITYAFGEKAEHVTRSLLNLENITTELYGDFDDELEKSLIIKRDCGTGIIKGVNDFADASGVHVISQICQRHVESFIVREIKKLIDNMGETEAFSDKFRTTIKVYINTLSNCTSSTQYEQVLKHVKDYILEYTSEEHQIYKYIMGWIEPTENYKPTFSLAYIHSGIGYMNNGAEGINLSWKKNQLKFESKMLLEILEITYYYFERTSGELKELFKQDDKLNEYDKVLFPSHVKLKGAGSIREKWYKVENCMNDYKLIRERLINEDKVSDLFIIGKTNFEQTVDEIIELLNTDSDTIQEVMNKHSKFYVYDVEEQCCTCISFAKDLVCKHQLLVYYKHLNMYENPQHSLELNKEKPQGRPVKEPIKNLRYGEALKVKRPKNKPIQKPKESYKIIEQERDVKRNKNNNKNKRK